MHMLMLIISMDTSFEVSYFKLKIGVSLDTMHWEVIIDLINLVLRKRPIV